MMYLCRMVEPDEHIVYGEGLNVKAAFEEACNRSEYAPAACEITFWKMEKTKIKVSFEPAFYDK